MCAGEWQVPGDGKFVLVIVGFFFQRKKKPLEIPGPENSSPVLSSIIATGHMKLLSTQNVAIIINKYWISKIVPKNVKYFYNVYMLVTF